MMILLKPHEVLALNTDELRVVRMYARVYGAQYLCWDTGLRRISLAIPALSDIDLLFRRQWLASKRRHPQYALLLQRLDDYRYGGFGVNRRAEILWDNGALRVYFTRRIIHWL